MKRKICKILEHNNLCGEYFYMRFEWENADSDFMSGQFVEVKVSEVSDPLLRRPISIFEADNNSCAIAYRVIGKGTKALSEKKIDEMLDVIGPLGNGFDIEKNKLKEKNIILVGGGTGLASLYYCAKKLEEFGYKFDIYAGFRSKDDFFCDEHYESLKSNRIFTTEDGAVGKKGFVTDFIDYKKLKTNESLIYSCGPLPMIRSLVENLRKNQISCECQVSLEEYMGCGIGICNGCVVKIKDEQGWKHKKVCKDGPVFDLDKIIWDEK
ncbi:dihydroorotate dehydrogenase electron transfer subunit [bacterium]